MTQNSQLTSGPAPETREKILASALTVFGEKGYHQATMAEIAEEAQVGKGTLYWHFASKEALFTGLIEQGVAVLGAKLQAILGNEARDYGWLLLEMIREYLSFFVAQRPLARLFSGNYSGLSQELREKLFQWHRKFNLFNQQLIVRGVEDGYFQPDLAVERAATALSGMITAFGNRQLVAGAEQQLEIEANFIYHVALKGFGKKKKGEPVDD